MGLFYTKFIVLILLTLFINNLFAQVNLVITDLKEKEQKLIIIYDIENYNKEDLFNVYVELITKEGNIINPKNAEGDINVNLTGEKNYKIIWDLAADSIFINEDVDVQLGADILVDISHFKYSSLMLSSTLLPGLGLKKIERKKSYLIMSILGYGTLGTSAYFYVQGEKFYSDYENESDPIKRSEFYNKANENRQNAAIAGLSAAGIWLLNYVWFTTKWKKKKKIGSPINKKLTLYGNYNSVLRKPMFTLSYKF